MWEGRGANEEEKRLGMELAVEYTRNAPDKRPADAPVYHIKSGREPRLFISAFHGWDRFIFFHFYIFLYIFKHIFTYIFCKFFLS